VRWWLESGVALRFALVITHKSAAADGFGQCATIRYAAEVDDTIIDERLFVWEIVPNIFFWKL